MRQPSCVKDEHTKFSGSIPAAYDRSLGPLLFQPYAEDLATGRTLEENSRVLRLRSHGAAFEFVMDRNETEKWRAALPPRRLGGGEARAV